MDDNIANVKKHSFWLDGIDEEAIAKLQEWYGLGTGSDAVRLALRLCLASGQLNIPESPEGFTKPPSPRRRPRRAAPEE